MLMLVLLESTLWRVLNANSLPPKISRYFMAKGYDNPALILRFMGQLEIKEYSVSGFPSCDYVRQLLDWIAVLENLADLLLPHPKNGLLTRRASRKFPFKHEILARRTTENHRIN